VSEGQPGRRVALAAEADRRHHQAADGGEREQRHGRAEHLFASMFASLRPGVPIIAPTMPADKGGMVERLMRRTAASARDAP
jgi:hypothetical protein